MSALERRRLSPALLNTAAAAVVVNQTDGRKEREGWDLEVGEERNKLALVEKTTRCLRTVRRGGRGNFGYRKFTIERISSSGIHFRFYSMHTVLPRAVGCAHRLYLYVCLAHVFPHQQITAPPFVVVQPSPRARPTLVYTAVIVVGGGGGGWRWR